MNFNAESDPNIKLNLLFPTPVIEVDLPMADQLIEPLRSAIYANKAASKGIMRSNILGWHSDTKMLEWGGDAAAVLAMETMKVCGRSKGAVPLRDGHGDVGKCFARRRFQPATCASVILLVGNVLC